MLIKEDQLIIGPLAKCNEYDAHCSSCCLEHTTTILSNIFSCISLFILINLTRKPNQAKAMLKCKKSEFHPCCSMMLSMMLEASKMQMLPPLTTSRPHSVFSCNAMQANLHPLTDYKLCLSGPIQIVHIQHHHHQSNPEEEVDFNWSVNQLGIAWVGDFFSANPSG